MLYYYLFPTSSSTNLSLKINGSSLCTLSIPSSSTTNPHHNCYMHTHSIPFSIMDLYNILCVLCFDFWIGVPNLNIVISHASVGAATVAEIMQERVAVGTVLHLLLPPGMFYGPLARCEG